MKTQILAALGEVDGLSALGAAIVGIGIPKSSVLDYEAALKADGFLVVASGPKAEMERARTMLETWVPSRLDLHGDLSPMAMTARSAVPLAAVA